MKKSKQKITIEGLTIEGKSCDLTLTFNDGLPASITESITMALKGSNTHDETPKEDSSTATIPDVESWSVRQKVRYIVLRNCRHGWFTSKDVQEIYDRTFHPTIPLATASTYLARMHKDGSLSRKGSVAQRQYRVNIEKLTEEIASILATKV